MTRKAKVLLIAAVVISVIATFQTVVAIVSGAVIAILAASIEGVVTLGQWMAYREERRDA